MNFRNSLIIHEQNTKEIIVVKESVINTCRFSQTFALIFSAYEHLYRKFFRKQTDDVCIKWIILEVI